MSGNIGKAKGAYCRSDQDKYARCCCNAGFGCKNDASRCEMPALVRAHTAGGNAPAAGEWFVPEGFSGGDYYPFCGHYFWDNNHGATAVCKALGFSGGERKKTRSVYDRDAMPVGRCNAGQAVDQCTARNNAWGDLDYRSDYKSSSNSGYCKKGNKVGVQVRCSGTSSSSITDLLPPPSFWEEEIEVSGWTAVLVLSVMAMLAVCLVSVACYSLNGGVLGKRRVFEKVVFCDSQIESDTDCEMKPMRV